MRTSTSDRVGNENNKNFDLVVDKTNPKITAAAIIGNENEIFYTSASEVPCKIEWEDSLTGIMEAVVRVTDNDNKVVFGPEVYYQGPSEIPFSMDKNEIKKYVHFVRDNVNSEEKYHIEWQVFDYAGNSSDWETIDTSVVLDYEAPVITVSEGSSFHIVNGKRYLNGDLDTEQFSAVIDDSNPDDIEWRLYDAEESLLGAGEIEEINSLIVSDGTYFLSVYGRDLAGNHGESKKIEFVYDTIAPVISLEDVNSDQTYYPGQKIEVELAAIEENSISHFILSCIPNSSIEANETNSIVITIDGNESSYLLTIPEGAVEDKYVVNLQAEDAWGNNSAVTTIYSFEVTIPDNYLTIVDADLYTSAKNTLYAEVEYHGEETIVQYEYKLYTLDIEGEAICLSDEWIESTSRILSVTFDTELEEGNRYYFEVRAQDDNGAYIEKAESIGTVIDRTPPEIETFYVPSYLGDAKLNVEWEVLENNDLSTMFIRLNKQSLVTEDNGDEEEYSIENLATL